MKAYWIPVISIFALLLAAMPAAALVACVEEDEGGRPAMIVEYGTGRDHGLVRVAHIHYAKPEAKAKPVKPAPTGSCYKLLGYKWANPIVYSVNTTNKEGLSQDFVIGAIENASEVWGVNTGAHLFNSISANDCLAQGLSDGKNCTSFGNYPQSGVIAVTYTWYKRVTKQAIESDILFDTDFAWGDALQDTNKMDLQNIAMHEIGHTLGLGDLYGSSCTEATMYGYSTEGETKKRSLEQGDIAGLQRIYGA